MHSLLSVISTETYFWLECKQFSLKSSTHNCSRLIVLCVNWTIVLVSVVSGPEKRLWRVGQCVVPLTDAGMPSHWVTIISLHRVVLFLRMCTTFLFLSVCTILKHYLFTYPVFLFCVYIYFLPGRLKDYRLLTGLFNVSNGTREYSDYVHVSKPFALCLFSKQESRLQQQTFFDRIT